MFSNGCYFRVVESRDCVVKGFKGPYSDCEKRKKRNKDINFVSTKYLMKVFCVREFWYKEFGIIFLTRIPFTFSIPLVTIFQNILRLQSHKIHDEIRLSRKRRLGTKMFMYLFIYFS